MDRFLKGLVSGIGAGFIMNFWGLLMDDLLHVSTRDYLDWTSVVLYGYLPTHLYESLFAFLAHLIWTGFLGIALSYILFKSSRHFLLKGALFGFLIGFFIFGIAILLRMPFFATIPFPTSVTNAIGGLIWGLTTAKMLDWLDSKDEKH